MRPIPPIFFIKLATPTGQSARVAIPNVRSAYDAKLAYDAYRPYEGWEKRGFQFFGPREEAAA